jgi:hypothetical protein
LILLTKPLDDTLLASAPSGFPFKGLSFNFTVARKYSRSLGPRRNRRGRAGLANCKHYKVFAAVCLFVLETKMMAMNEILQPCDLIGTVTLRYYYYLSSTRLACEDALDLRRRLRKSKLPVVSS